MLREDYSVVAKADVVTISIDEYADLIRAAAQLDVILTMGAYTPDALCRAIARERNIERSEG